MTQLQWQYFCQFRQEFKEKVAQWNLQVAELGAIQKQAAAFFQTPEYSFENPVVYNTDLDKLTQDDEIKLIVIGDNPGKDEQLTKNQRYLVGQAGKIAEGFFRRNPELAVDFRKNVIILNKTPVHSAKTNQLKKMISLGGSPVSQLIQETQIWMAQKTAALHQNLNAAAQKPEQQTELWLVGYSELKAKGIFELYRDTLKAQYTTTPAAWQSLYVFQHFSMNRFSIDLNSTPTTHLLEERIHHLGQLHKSEIFDTRHSEPVEESSVGVSANGKN